MSYTDSDAHAHKISINEVNKHYIEYMNMNIVIINC